MRHLARCLLVAHSKAPEARARMFPSPVVCDWPRVAPLTRLSVHLLWRIIGTRRGFAEDTVKYVQDTGLIGNAERPGSEQKPTA